MKEISTARKWFGLLSLMPGIAMMFVDQSILPVALPTIQSQLGATYTQLWWSVNSYLLLSAILLLAGGKLGDRIGHKVTFTLGIIIFAIASALCGLSKSIEWLIAARALQGAGSALMIPATSPLIMSLFPQKERGKAIGLNISLSALFSISGPLIGGYLTEALSWHWIFWVNLPLAALGLVMVFFFLPTISPKEKQRFDTPGFFYFTLASTGLIVFIMQATEWGLFAFGNGFFVLVTLICSYLLFRREKATPYPFFDRKLFRHPVFSAVNLSVFATQFVLMITIYRAVFFQDVLDWSPMKSGAVSMITSVPVLFTSYVGGWLSDKFGPRIPISIGFFLLTFSFFWLAFLIQASMPIVLIGLFAMGFGVPFIFTPSYSSAMSVIPPKEAGSAFGTLATVRALSSCLGVALISCVATFSQFRSFSQMIDKNPATHHLNAAALEGLNKGVSSIERTLTRDELPIVLNSMKQSQLQGFFSVHISIGIALIIAFIFVFFLYKRKSTHQTPDAPSDGWD